MGGWVEIKVPEIIPRWSAYTTFLNWKYVSRVRKHMFLEFIPESVLFSSCRKLGSRSWVIPLTSRVKDTFKL